MKRYRDLILTSSVLDAFALARYVEAFADQSSDWDFPRQESSLYEQTCGKPSCCIVSITDALPRAAIHMTKKKDNSLYAANIIPLDSNKLTSDQYNTITVAFAGSIRAHAKQSATKIVVKLSKAEIRLADIVPGKIPWKLLNRYLTLYPLSHHPLDIGRLDTFICSLYRYSRKQFDLDSFEVLLGEELGWSSRDAKWCRSRVEIGLEILTANKSFHG